MSKRQYTTQNFASVGRRVTRRVRLEKREASEITIEAIRGYIALPSFPEEGPTPTE
jgi:hypothetical protein